jgi:hypothetical protein
VSDLIIWNEWRQVLGVLAMVLVGMLLVVDERCGLRLCILSYDGGRKSRNSIPGNLEVEGPFEKRR